MGKLKYQRIPVILSDLGKNDKLDYCVLPVMKRYKSLLDNNYNLQEDVRGMMLYNLYIDKIISAGGWGVVVRGYDILDKKYYAVKLMRPQLARKDFISEVEAFNRLSRYPNCDESIVCMYTGGNYSKPKETDPKYLEAFYTDEKTKYNKFKSLEKRYKYITMELMTLDLYDFFENMVTYQGENWAEKYPEILLKVFKSLLEGISVIHAAGLAHSDLKPENVLVKLLDSEDPCEFYRNPDVSRLLVKIGDLGLVCAGRNNLSISRCIVRATPAYASPEVNMSLDSSNSLEGGQKLDIWSLGLILGWMIYYKEIHDLLYANENFHYAIKEDEEEKGIETIYREYEERYYEFMGGLPGFNSKYEDLNFDIVIMFNRMLALNPKKRDPVDDLIAMLPPLL